MVPVIFSDGWRGSTPFVVEETRVKYLQIKSRRTYYLEILVEYLSRSSVLSTREEVARVDEKNCVECHKMFVSEMKIRTSSGHKLLLIWDSYRCHMSYAAFDISYLSKHLPWVLILFTPADIRTPPLPIVKSKHAHMARNALRIFCLQREKSCGINIAAIARHGWHDDM